MATQHTHSSTPFTQKLHDIVLVCDGVSGPANVGGLFRLCDALGVKHIYFGNAEIDFSSERLKRTSREAHKHIPYAVSEDMSADIQKLAASGYRLVALEITDTSLPLSQFQKDPSEKIALIIGNEQHGISSEVLNVVTDIVHIEMFGLNSSMNVVHATAIALHTLIA